MINLELRRTVMNITAKNLQTRVKVDINDLSTSPLMMYANMQR
jgi:hypothetical protein